MSIADMYYLIFGGLALIMTILFAIQDEPLWAILSLLALGLIGFWYLKMKEAERGKY